MMLQSRVNASIAKLLASRKDVSIFVLAEAPPLSWGGFQISLAAGLHHSLLETFKPTWNVVANSYDALN